MAGHKHRGTVCGCCGGEVCPSFGDGFSDGMVGPEWTAVSGAWSETGSILTTSDTGAILITDGGGIVTDYGSAGVAIPYGGGSSTPAKKFLRVLGAYTDADNHLFVDIELDHQPSLGTLLTLRLYERIDGSDTLIEQSHSDFGVSTYPLGVSLCWNGRNAVAFANNFGFPETVEATGPSALTGGIGGVGTGTEATNIAFDSFALQPLAIDGGAAALCGRCLSCRDICTTTPESVVVTAPSRFSNGTCENCESINGTRYVLDRQTNYQYQMPDPFAGAFEVGKRGSCVYRYTEDLGCGYWLQITAWPAWTLMFAIRAATADGNILGFVVYRSAVTPAPGQSCCPKDWELEFFTRFGPAVSGIFAVCPFSITPTPDPITITTECYGYDEVKCCEGSDRPATLTAAIYKDGVLWGEITLYYCAGSLPGNFSYTEDPDCTEFDTHISCIQELGDTSPVFGIESEAVSLVLTTESCSPFHFTGSTTAGASEWEVEIIE